MHRSSWSHMKEKAKGKLKIPDRSRNPLPAASSNSNIAKASDTEIHDSSNCHGEDTHPIGSLWDKAYDILRKDHVGLVDAFEKILSSEADMELSSNLGLINSVEREKQMSLIVAKKLAMMEEKQWRLNTLSDKTVLIREKVDRIVKIVLVVKDFGSSLASMDPIHAGLPWAGLIVNDTKQRSAAIDGLEDVSQLVRRYSEIENIYLRSEDVIDTQDLQAAIVKLYRRVLEYEARAACQFNRNTAIQMARNVVKADSWDGILTAIKTEHAACKDLIAIIDAKSQRQGKMQLMDLLAEQDLKIDEILHKLHKEDEIHKKLLSERQNWRQKDEERDCLQSFRNSDYERYKSRNPDRVNGTCVWFLKHPNFKDWLGKEKSRLLWVSADPGCGKSVLSKSLIDNELRCTDSRTTCYFFFKDDNLDQKSATKAICALLHQLFSQKPMLLKYALTGFWNNGQIQRDLFSSLWGILERATADPEAGEVVCIVDALDECEVSGRLELIESLIRLHDKSSSDQTTLKFLVTSRPYVSIERRFKQLTNTFPTVRLAGEAESKLISHEIEKVIKAKVQDFGVDLDLAVSVRKSLEEKLLSVPHRTYLWLELIFDLISKQLQVTEKRLLKMIDTLPDTVSKAYTAILKKSTDLPKARKLLHIIVAARRPLTLRETNVALAVGKDSRSYDDLDLEQEDRFHVTVRNLCGLFVSVVDSKIYLIHQTAKEFLIRDKDMARPAGQGGDDQGDWEHSLEPGESNLILTNVCVSYLLFDVFESEPFFGEFKMRVLLDKYKRYYKWLATVASPASELETSASELPGTSADDLEEEIGSDPQKYLKAIQEWCNSGFTEYAGRHAFLEYSSMNWAPHFRCANTEDDIVLSKSALTLCNPQYSRFPAWFLAYLYEYPVYWDLFHPFGPDITPLMTVSFLGLEAPMQMLLGKQGMVNTELRDSTGRTALL